MRVRYARFWLSPPPSWREGGEGVLYRLPSHQRGAAVLMALFVAALATMIITGLFYRQFVLLRTIENQQLTSQSRLLLRGALDWGRAILREDAKRSQYDALSEPWSQPLAETRLDQLGETGSLAALATIAGSMEDAQGRFNLRNLVENGQVLERELQALQRLVSLLQLPEADGGVDRAAYGAGDAGGGGCRSERPPLRCRAARARQAASAAADASAGHRRDLWHRPGGRAKTGSVYRRARRAHSC